MSTKTRIHILDVLRGFAIVSIMLLHSIEHFDIYYFPEHLPAWMKSLDGAIWETMFFLFSGKSYSIFALLFGVTYAIQLSRQKEKGQSFAGRFAWRMVLLFAFGILNSAFFQGDVLTIYAVLGVLLIPFSKLKDSIILGIAIILLVLPYEWSNLIYALQHPDEKINDPISWSYFGKMLTYVGEPSLWDTIIGNLTNGKIGVLRWNWENGRFFTILALFLLGYLLGKHQKFHETDKNLEFWTQILKISIIAFIPLYFLKRNMDHFIESDIIRRSALTIETSITNFSFMLVLVSGITLLFYKTKARNVLMYFSRFGRMSMSNYIIQSILGGAIFYGWGLGLYKYTGATYGLLIGLALTIVTGIFCKWWAKRYKQGPFETLWHKATWI
ncbi:DUF418 domain-containing protein [uncultured Aquimarina sp.]|uniref:DUF418 domain-containing protein n=1 Tax=uncultured Aquimarina sp. TaxID=575652 RepID=UPI002608A959|nr:DUF418 domain-containing protein [uncultured Aquimarina sp.]